MARVVAAGLKPLDTDDKQAAADAATDCWWAKVATEVPRDIDGKVILIAARVLVRRSRTASMRRMRRS